MTASVYIAGVAETPLGKVYDHSEMSMAALASREALAEAGMTLRDVDGLFTNYMGEEGSVQLGEYLGVQPRFAESSDMGGWRVRVFRSSRDARHRCRSLRGCVNRLCIEATDPKKPAALDRR